MNEATTNYVNSPQKIINPLIEFTNTNNDFVNNPFERNNKLDPIRIVFEKETTKMPGNDDHTESGAAVGGDTTHYTTVNEFMNILQTTLKSSQDEFRKELQIITDSVSNLNIAVQSLEANGRRNINAPADHSRETAHSTSSTYLDSSNNVKLKDWNVKYDGSGSVSDLIFKIETLKLRTQCADEHLLANFNIFLAGRAES